MYYELVIIGGGAGGLELAAKLGRKLKRKKGKNKILLIDKFSYHVWKPILHEIAVGTLDPLQEGISYGVLARRNNFSFILGELEHLNPSQNQIILSELKNDKDEVIIPKRKITYEYCVLAIGSGSNSFNTPGIDYAYKLEKTTDAITFHNNLLGLFTKASYSDEKNISIIIVGAGATGIELATEMIEAYNEIKETFGPQNRFRIKISVLEAGDRILSTLNPKTSEDAKRVLEKKGIEILLNTKVLKVNTGSVETNNGNFPVDIVVWAAGVKSYEFNRNFNLETNELNQFVVDNTLKTSNDFVYAIGDCSYLIQKNKVPVPARALAAHQQAKFLTRLFLAKFHQKEFKNNYSFKNSGSLVSLGNNRGVAELSSSFRIQGLFAKYMYVSLHLMHHYSILGFNKTLLLALSRLAQKRVSGHTKIHL